MINNTIFVLTKFPYPFQASICLSLIMVLILTLGVVIKFVFNYNKFHESRWQVRLIFWHSMQVAQIEVLIRLPLQDLQQRLQDRMREMPQGAQPASQPPHLHHRLPFHVRAPPLRLSKPIKYL